MAVVADMMCKPWPQPTQPAPCRAIGDDIASLAGCTARPTVRHMRLQEGDSYIVIASDGVWDVLSNDEVSCCSLMHALTLHLALQPHVLCAVGISLQPARAAAAQLL